MSDLNIVYIETERLVVRTFDDNDFEQFERLLDLYEGWQMQKPRAKEFFNWHLSNYKNMDIITGTLCLGVFEKETGDILGRSLHKNMMSYMNLNLAMESSHVQEGKVMLRRLQREHLNG